MYFMLGKDHARYINFLYHEAYLHKLDNVNYQNIVCIEMSMNFIEYVDDL